MKKHSTNWWPSGWLLGLLGLLANWPAPTQAQTKSPKRGVAYDFTSAADLQALAPGLSWWYGWAPIPKAAVANTYQGLGSEFVPMQWDEILDGSTVTANRLAAATSGWGCPPRGTNVPVALGLQQRGLEDGQRAEDVRLAERPHVRRGGFLNGAHQRVAGVVEHHVEPPEVRVRLRDLLPVN
ncbi:hypothetical protein BEN49_21420 [Hymenobacter coccineus]|uniref:Asl1-like glycosyl hydrolase catalytic domain-containing protein n=1 Tax=Hymenobacter coccineus TaxID=1908235 RepID=A0A1G1TJI2_9BACT|nr:hypothetical protein BEN49_21420 [Hymenobacter coccineus]